MPGDTRTTEHRRLPGKEREARAEPTPTYQLPQTASVKAASARLAGLRSRFKSASPMRASEREAGYLEQTGRRELTPAQARRAAKKQRKAIGA